MRRRDLFKAFTGTCTLYGITEIKGLKLRQDDFVILKSPDRLSSEACKRLRESAKEVFGSHKVIILESGLDIEIVRPE